MAIVELNADVFTAILDHIDDVGLVQSIALAVPPSHEFFSIALRRRCALPIVLTVGSPEYTRKLLERLLSFRGTVVKSISSLHIALGPSQNHGFDEHLLERVVHRIDFAHKLQAQLPELFEVTTNLQELTWTRAPAPDSVNLQTLASLQRLRKFSVDCATGEWSGRMDDNDEYWRIEPFFSTLAPKLFTIDFRNVDESAYKMIMENSASLSALRNLKMDITCGCWDWDGAGSPQRGASETYVFPRLACAEQIRSFELIATDITLGRANAGPLGLVAPEKLEALILHVETCFSWVALRHIMVLSSLESHQFQSLVHLEIHDEVAYDGVHRWEIDPLNREREERRIYSGLHEFIGGLSRLRRLWVDQRSLLLRKPSEEADDWSGSNVKFTSIKETMESPQWALVSNKLYQLESLRVGLGAVNAHWVNQILQSCDRDKLRQFGFEWDWNANGRRKRCSDFRGVAGQHPPVSSIDGSSPPLSSTSSNDLRSRR